eukprot:TRINITY_DN12260_c0_g1_i2.p1 TRINITY_DN12260_c0_g1~~TRINITY_DN12260_c0_g1_i2.p1  ORF type:complete len:147 (+),score=15.17 TRINITY_DN12260_c0_g1_i2:101-541(+)
MARHGQALGGPDSAGSTPASPRQEQVRPVSHLREAAPWALDEPPSSTDPHGRKAAAAANRNGSPSLRRLLSADFANTVGAGFEERTTGRRIPSEIGRPRPAPFAVSRPLFGGGCSNVVVTAGGVTCGPAADSGRASLSSRSSRRSL